MQKTGNHALIEQLLADGMTYMFGNPGTVEQGWLDALADYPEMRYIETLQESVAVLMGDGYARATKGPALVQIHSTPGLGNAIGAIYQAMRGHAPLIVIGGDAGIQYMPMAAQMYGDLVGMAEPVTKWSTMVLDHRSLLRTLRRAVKVALTPPMGPVYICLPADILDMPMVEEVRPTFIPSTNTTPADNFVMEASRELIAAERPMFFIGDRVAYAHAQPEVERVAELLGAEVYGVDSGELNMRYDHPQYMGQTGHMFGTGSYPITSKGDINLVVGTYMVPEVFPKLDDIYAPDAKVIHIDSNDWSIAQNHRVDMGVVSDPKQTLAELADCLDLLMTPAQKKAAEARREEIGRKTTERRNQQIAKDDENADAYPMQTASFMRALAAQLPDDAIIFDEALTSSPPMTRYMPPTQPDSFFQTRGGSLGVGIPGALAAKIANPDRTVIGFTGDGGSMYTIQALWTAAHHNINAKFVICNNQSYMLLKMNVEQYWETQGIEPHDHPAPFSLIDPVIDFVQVAAGMGVPGVRVERIEEADAAIEQMLNHDGPFLIDMVVSSELP